MLPYYITYHDYVEVLKNMASHFGRLYFQGKQFSNQCI
jgi:hypothetical protein